MVAYARESDKGLRIDDEEPTRPRGMESGVLDVAPAVEVDESVSDDDAEQVCWARIGDERQVPALTQPLEELLWEVSAPGDALVLSTIDGARSVRAIVDECGLVRHEALQVLCDLVDQGIVRLGR
jgi:hypothetical protein